MSKKTTSFKIFIIAASLVAIVFLGARLPLYFFHADFFYAMVLAIILFIAMIFALIGFFSGLKFKSEDERLRLFNKIGLIGNLIVFVIIVILFFFALL